MRAKKAGAGTRGRAAGAAKRTFVGLVARDIHIEQSACGDGQFHAAAAAVNQCSCSDDDAAFFLDDADGFAGRASRGPNVFDDKDTLRGLKFKAAAEGHVAGAVAFDEERAHTQGARHLVADQNPAESRGNNATDGVLFEKVRKGAAELFRLQWMLEDERALKIGVAVAAARKLKMTLADASYLFEKLDDFFTFHRASRRRQD